MNSFDASTDPELAMLGAALPRLLERARRHDVDVLLVGAAARDVLIRHATGALPQRATADVDIAVAVADWAAYTRLTAELSPAGKSSHTFRVAAVEVDIVPFGGIESADRTISWPDGHLMNTLGFREALGCAITVTLPDGATVNVASLPAQAALKLQAWRDRRLITTRDAIDLRTILHAYSDGPYLDQLYDTSEHILAAYDFDPQLAGTHASASNYATPSAPRSPTTAARSSRSKQQAPIGSPQKWAARSNATDSSSTPLELAPRATETKDDAAVWLVSAQVQRRAAYAGWPRSLPQRR